VTSSRHIRIVKSRTTSQTGNLDWKECTQKYLENRSLESWGDGWIILSYILRKLVLCMGSESNCVRIVSNGEQVLAVLYLWFHSPED
jgi:hypothetical protein